MEAESVTRPLPHGRGSVSGESDSQNRARKQADLAIVNCSQLVTVAGDPIADGAMLVRDGRITAIGTRAEIEALITDEEVIDAERCIVLPGFVDAHTHPVFAGNRADEFEMRVRGVSYEAIAAKGGGIRSTVRRTREASEDDLLAAARRYRTWFLRGGTTTVEGKSGYGLSLEAELKMLRVIRAMGYIPTFLGAHEVPDEYRGRLGDYVELVVQEMLPAVAGVAEYCDVFCEPTVFPAPAALRIVQAAKAHGLGIRLHADQFCGDYGSIIAAETGAVTADHLEATTEAGLRALQTAGVQPVLLPASVYALGLTKYPAARRMLELGMRVVLATDFNPGSSPTASMPMVLSLACTQMKMTPMEAIAAATINAAHSLGRAREIGSLEPGKRADFVIHDCADFRELPYFFGRETAKKVFIAGELQALS
jgi:imidazolonepropionase